MLFAGAGVTAVLCCAGLLAWTFWPSRGTWEITIQEIVVDDAGQVRLSYRGECNNGREQKTILDGMDYGGSRAGSWPPFRQKFSGTALFHVNQARQPGDQATWLSRVLVKAGAAYGLREGEQLDLYQFVDGETDRHGYIVVGR